MNLKYFLRGLGTGIIFSTIILAILYSSLPTKEMSKEDIIIAAKDLGMVEDNLRLPESSIKPTPTKKPVVTSTPVPTKKPVVTSTPVSTKKPTPTKKPVVTSTPVPTSTPVSISTQEVSFTISSGMGSTSVATTLESKGLISNASEFDAYLVKNGYQSKIRTGQYTVKKGTTYSQIAKLIT